MSQCFAFENLQTRSQRLIVPIRNYGFAWFQLKYSMNFSLLYLHQKIKEQAIDWVRNLPLDSTSFLNHVVQYFKAAAM